ncbi:MAG TPA: hypothetical protein VNJ51_14695 [Candidatus Dormibacteraeota bacterium]|nr:hypothetical protein [Candidatus Dormibacteraeota bacterium]
MTQAIVVGLLFAAFLVLAVYRQTRERRTSLLGMWSAPAVFVVLAALVAAEDHLTTPLAIAVLLAAALVGIPLGLYQGVHCTVQVDRAARRITYKANPIGVAIILAALGFRFGIKMATGSLASPHPLSGTAALMSTVALALAVGMVIGLRIHMQRCYNAAPPQASAPPA